MNAQVKTEYQIQADEFLAATGTTLEVTFSHTGKYFADDTEKRDIYNFTLKNDKGEYSATFGDSLNNTKYNSYITRTKSLDYKEDFEFCKANKIPVTASGYTRPNIRKRRTPEAYDILACLGSYVPETFDEFCEEYGYNDLPLSDHDKIMKIYLSCREEQRGLNRIFTSEQLEMLQDIS